MLVGVKNSYAIASAALFVASLPALEGYRATSGVRDNVATGARLEEGVAAAAGVLILDRYLLKNFEYRQYRGGIQDAESLEEADNVTNFPFMQAPHVIQQPVYQAPVVHHVVQAPQPIYQAPQVIYQPQPVYGGNVGFTPQLNQPAQFGPHVQLHQPQVQFQPQAHQWGASPATPTPQGGGETAARPKQSFPDIDAKRAEFNTVSPSDHLGTGSFGDVWKAYDKELKKEVAVKILYTKDSMGQLVYANWQRAASDPQLKAELDRNKFECDIVKNMFQESDKDPTGASRICGCYREHVSDAEDKPLRPVFLVQEMCGSSLTKYFFKTHRSQSKQLTLARQLTAQMLEGIRFLSKLDTPIVHHDMKPDNVNVMADGAVKIIDWGAMAKGLRTNMGGGAAWTPAYAPPEALNGQVSFYVDLKGKAHSYDLYAIGLMYLDMLTPQLQISQRQMYKPLQQPFINNLISSARGSYALTELALDISVLEVALKPEPVQRPTPEVLRKWMGDEMSVSTPHVEEEIATQCFQKGTDCEYYSVTNKAWIPVRIGKETPKGKQCIYDLVDPVTGGLVKSDAAGEKLRLKNQDVDLQQDLIAASSGGGIQYMKPVGKPNLLDTPLPNRQSMPQVHADPQKVQEPKIPSDLSKLPAAVTVLSQTQLAHWKSTYQMKIALACSEVPGFKTECEDHDAWIECDRHPKRILERTRDPSNPRVQIGVAWYHRDVQQALQLHKYTTACVTTFTAHVNFSNSQGSIRVNQTTTAPVTLNLLM
eukprot:TRINITY_DN24156_c0_g1_i1.p1 TRINITY_DN24156_c0_g1~~TRINITY_DN24156_c0_g1_i1.p1  ORF type:complete len:763 (-),score=166.00 TRINITY_DN24156_c0_g1_i1:195-2483(-)